MATVTKSSSSAPAGSAGATYKTTSGQLVNSAGQTVGGAVTSRGLSYNGTDIIGGSTVNKADAPKNFTGQLGSGVITPASLAPVNPINLPVAPVTPNYSGLTASALASAGINADGTIKVPATDMSSTTQAPTLDNLLATELNLREQNAPVKTEDIYNKSYAEAGIANKQQLVNNYTNQLNAIQAKATADQLSLTGQGRGVPEAIIGGQQAQIAKEAAIAALPVSAQLAAAQGDLKLAQDHLDTLFKLQVADATAQYDYKNKVIDSVLAYATKAEQRQFDQAKTDNARNYDEQKARLQENSDFAKTIIDTQPGLAAQFTKLDPASPTYKRDFAALVSQVTPDKKIELENKILQQKVDAAGGNIDVSKLSPEGKALMDSVVNLRFASVEEAGRIIGNVRNTLYRGDYEGAKKQLEQFGVQKLGTSERADYRLYANAEAAASSALNQIADQNITTGPYAAIANSAAPWAKIKQDEKYVDLKSTIELGQAQLRKGFYGTAVTDSESKNARSFLVGDNDSIDTIKWKLKNTSDFLRFTNDATIADAIGLPRPNLDDYLTYRVKDKKTGQTGLIPRSEYIFSEYEIINK